MELLFTCFTINGKRGTTSALWATNSPWNQMFSLLMEFSAGIRRGKCQPMTDKRQASITLRHERVIQRCCQQKLHFQKASGYGVALSLKKGLADQGWQLNQTRLSGGTGSWQHPTSMLSKSTKAQKVSAPSDVYWMYQKTELWWDVAAQKTLEKCQNK